MIHEPVENDKPYPPEASAGPDNAYYLKGCDIVQRPAAYAACLFKINEAEAGREHELHACCAESINTKRCEAMGMRDQEKLLGKAMFYFPRRPPQALIVPGSMTERITNLTDPARIPKDPPPVDRFGNAITRKPAATAKPAPAIPSDPDTGGYADAINAAMAELVTPEPVKAATLDRLDGETPMQYARRVREQRQQEQK